MSITRPPTLGPEDMEKLLERMANSGARLTMVDPRVSATQNWILGTIGAGLVVVGGWAVTSINNLNTTMARVIEQNNSGQRTDAAQDRRFDNQDRRMDGFDERLREAERRP